jgi:hypothetical protein
MAAITNSNAPAPHSSSVDSVQGRLVDGGGPKFARDLPPRIVGLMVSRKQVGQKVWLILGNVTDPMRMVPGNQARCRR